MLKLEYDRGTLVFDGEVPVDAPPELRYDERTRQWRAEGQYYRRLKAWLQTSRTPHEDNACAYRKVPLRHLAHRAPFEHQAQALEAWLSAGKRGLVILPTGAGKTYVAELAMQATQRSTLVVVPTLELLSQWYDRLCTVFETDVGLVGGGHHTIAPVTVTTYDSAYIHLEKLGNQFGLLIYDEVHHLPSDTMCLSAVGSIAPYRLGLTATVERADGRHELLGGLVGPVVHRSEITQLAGDVLADYRIETIEVDLTDAERQEYDEEYALYRAFVDAKGLRLGSEGGWVQFLGATNRSAEGRRALAAYRRQKSISEAPEAKFRLMEAVLRQHHGERVLIFTNSNPTAYQVARELLIPVISHQTDPMERREILEAFRAGSLRCIATSRVLNEGVDVPEASVAIVFSGTGSTREHVQRLGRVLRRSEGKSAVLYELVSRDTAEQGTSRRRREHDAYQ